MTPVENPWAQLAILSVSMCLGLYLFYGDRMPFLGDPLRFHPPPKEQDVNFFIINDVDSATIQGVLLESKEGILGARLAGDKGTDDAASVVRALLRRMPALGFPLEVGQSTHRQLIRYRPGQPDFAKALLWQLKPPLSVNASGLVPQARIDKAKTPEKISEDLWILFEGMKETIPEYTTLMME